MVEPDSHGPAYGLTPLYPARCPWPAVRFLFAKAAKKAILERASNAFLKKITTHTDGVDRRNGNGDQFSCFIQQRVGVCLIDFSRVNEKFDPVSGLICFLQHVAKFGNEGGFGFGEASRTVIGPNGPARPEQLPGENPTCFVLGQCFAELNNLQGELFGSDLKETREAFGMSASRST
jgi:hypothetical protein